MIVESGLAMAVCATSCAAWRRWFHHNLIPKNFGVVEAGRVYRSARLTPHALRIVHRRTGIRTIVDLSGASRPEQRQNEFRVIDELGIKRHSFTGLGGTGWHGDPEIFARALALLADPANHPILLHCAAGANRTSTLAVLYAHLFQGVDLATAGRNCRPFRCDLTRRPEHWQYIVQAVPVVQRLLEDAARQNGLSIDLPWRHARPLPISGMDSEELSGVPVQHPALIG